jgi:hypothetical protein
LCSGNKIVNNVGRLNSERILNISRRIDNVSNIINFNPDEIDFIIEINKILFFLLIKHFPVNCLYSCEISEYNGNYLLFTLILRQSNNIIR